MHKTKLLLALALPLTLALALAGLSVAAEAADPQLGITVQNNIALQAVDMNPRYAGAPMEGGNGQRSIDAYRRYLMGNVKDLVKMDGKAAVGGQGGAQAQQTLQPAGK